MDFQVVSVNRTHLIDVMTRFANSGLLTPDMIYYAKRSYPNSIDSVSSYLEFNLTRYSISRCSFSEEFINSDEFKNLVVAFMIKSLIVGSKDKVEVVINKEFSVIVDGVVNGRMFLKNNTNNKLLKINKVNDLFNVIVKGNAEFCRLHNISPGCGSKRFSAEVEYVYRFVNGILTREYGSMDWIAEEVADEEFTFVEISRAYKALLG